MSLTIEILAALFRKVNLQKPKKKGKGKMELGILEYFSVIFLHFKMFLFSLCTYMTC